MTDIYDHITADQDLAEGDQIVYENDFIEITKTYVEGEAVVVHGYSHISGDTVFYIIPLDAEVGLWTV